MRRKCRKTGLQNNEVGGSRIGQDTKKGELCETLTHWGGGGLGLVAIIFLCHFRSKYGCGPEEWGELVRKANETEPLRTHWHRAWSDSRTQKNRTATVKKLSHELRKLRIEWGTHRVTWHCGGRECLLAGSKKSGLQRRAGEAAYEQVKPKKTDRGGGDNQPASGKT
jgi:hypothetical protein